MEGRGGSGRGYSCLIESLAACIFQHKSHDKKRKIVVGGPRHGAQVRSSHAISHSFIGAVAVLLHVFCRNALHLHHSPESVHAGQVRTLLPTTFMTLALFALVTFSLSLCTSVTPVPLRYY